MVPARFIRVSSLARAPILAAGWAQQVISLLDPDIGDDERPNHTMFNLPENEHHIQYLYDVERGHRRPTYAAVVQILAFARTDTRILVHCHAGMSRSPSIAISLLIARGMPAREAVRFIFAQNLYDNEGSYMEPNELILRHADIRLGLGNSLVQIVREEMVR